MVQTAFLGDVVLTLPLIHALRQRFGAARVDVLTVPAHAPVLQGQADIDTVLTYDKRHAQRGLWGLVEVGRMLRVRGYDLILSPHRSMRSACLVALSGATWRIGFDHWLTRWAYTQTVPRPDTAHEVERNLQLLTVCGGNHETVSGQMTLRVCEVARRAAWDDLAASGAAEGDIVIGLIPGSQWATKRWPEARFAALIERLSTEPGIHCVLFGGPQDRPIAEAIRTRCRAHVIDRVGHTALGDLPAYVANCTVVVSNDTGPMHIAAALGKPIVALFGPTTPAMGFAPYGVRWEEASVSLPCRPCHAHGPSRCPLSHWRCMQDLRVEHVASSVYRLLSHVGHAHEVGV